MKYDLETNYEKLQRAAEPAKKISETPPVTRPFISNLLNSSSTPNPIVKPSLSNLLNPSEELAFEDIIASMSEPLEETPEGSVQVSRDAVEERLDAYPGPDPDAMEVDGDLSFPSDAGATTTSLDGTEDVAVDPATGSSIPQSTGSSKSLNLAWSSLFSQKSKQGRSDENVNQRKQGRGEKRPRSPADDTDSLDCKSSTGKSASKKTKRSSSPLFGPVGLAKSSKSSMASRRAADRGEVTVEAREKWKKKILAVDSRAEFYEDDFRGVRCSNCGNKRLVKDANDWKRFEKHYISCVDNKRDKKPSNVKTSRTSTLTSGFLRFRWKTVSSSGVTVDHKPLPCPGLTEADEKRIPVYLGRTGASGGGARSITKIAKEHFASLFRQLRRHEKDAVLDLQSHEHKWRNDHRKLCVFATDCDTLAKPGRSAESRPLPCQPCAMYCG